MEPTERNQRTEDLLDQVMARIAALPEDQQLDSMLEFASVMLKHVDASVARNMRAAIIAQGESPDSEIVRLIDGNLALREIQAS